MSSNYDRVTIEDYLENETIISAKNEYIDGNVFPIMNGDLNHNVIRTNLMFEIMTNLRGKGYRIFTGDTRLWITDDETDTEVIYYPDIMVCENKDNAPNYVTDPTLVIEVVSAFSERQDLGEKLNYYSSIRSLKEYVTVDERQQRIERYSLEGRVFRAHIDPDAHLNFNSLGFRIPVKDIYNGVSFGG